MRQVTETVHKRIQEDLNMDNMNYHKAKKMVLIPIMIILLAVVCFILASILEQPTNRGTLYSILALIAILIIFMSPIPCLVMSVIGTILAIKAVKEGTAQARKYIVIGMIEILAHIVFVVLGIAMFIGGQSV